MPSAARPKVSVIIPCYNLGEFLDEAVESVLAQTCQDFEIIVIDDGSTEPATRALLAGYRRRSTTVIRAAHGGLAAALNPGRQRVVGTVRGLPRWHWTGISPPIFAKAS